jgi:predicted signal transduction protein with EAL and GGDEF domain
VETRAQADELLLLGCHTAQGFHYCAPLVPEGVDVFLAGDTTDRVRIPRSVPTDAQVKAGHTIATTR